MSKIQSTYKSRETEEFLDVIFYRPFGYRLALASRRVGLTPNGVTLVGTIAGSIAGLLLLSANVWYVAVAAALLIFSEAMDSADGQLARLTSNFSEIGRVVDGFAGYVAYMFIYIAVGISLADYFSGGVSIALMAVTLLAHTMQAMTADYYRTCYISLTGSGKRAELEESSSVLQRMERAHGFDKLMLYLYWTYTKSQEQYSGRYGKLHKLIAQRFPGELPDAFREEYRRLNRPNIKYYNIMQQNTRLIALIIAMFAGRPDLFIGFILIGMNLLLLLVVVKQQIAAKKLINFIENNYEA